jgi:hypothetical protein
VKANTPPMNEIEQECIILNSAWEMIDGMVNWAMFVKHDRTEPTNMMFETGQHSRLFTILLGDFLSQLRAFRSKSIPLGLRAAPSNARPSDLTFLYYLRQVCAKPHFAPLAADLSAHTEAFAAWLEGEFIAKGVNLGSIGIVANLRIQRYRYIKICGDIAKHNLARLETNVGHIRRLVEASGHSMSEHQAYLAVEDFFEWFHTDIFIYHSSHIAEFLNNIRWAIFDYLQPEFARSWHKREGYSLSFPWYGYHYPDGCIEPLARAMYWDLMNRVRSRPRVHRFIVSDSFKTLY